jgi:HAD superfamily hydrolase (TIGR01490 family)
MKKIVFFDVDNVLIKDQTQKILLQFLFKKRKISIFFFIKIYLWFLLYKFSLIEDTINIRKKAYNVLTNWSISETERFFEIFFDQEIKPRIFNKSISIIKNHINQNHEVILISASLFEIVDKLRGFLSLRFVISTKLKRINGRYTGEILGVVPYGKNKVEEVKRLIEDNNFTLENSYAYTDHFSDLPLLELVTNPVTVNPDRKLRRIAKERGWAIYDF